MTEISITELNSFIKDNVKKTSLKNLKIKGEISGLKKYNNTIYASLKDDISSINIIKFRSNDDNIKNGDLVIISGYLEFYTKNGTIQIICNNIEHTGEGYILKNLEDLKIKFKNKGYFDNKKKIPENIKSIGIVTASNGAALQDILYVFNNNKFDGKIFVKNSPVQGVDCPKGICNGIKYFNQFKDDNKRVDLIMITRGGGGIDDLMGFSDSSVIEEIHISNIFVISAVGHEVDNMISDYVADLRAPTPSIGAEIISKSKPNKISIINSYREKLDIYIKFIHNKYDNIKKNFNLQKKKMYIKIYELNIKRINNIEEYINDIIKTKINKINNNLITIKSNIDIIKNNEYNAVLMYNNNIIDDVDKIKNGIYIIKINGKNKKIEININN